jgi:hypothetical protein
MSLQHSPGIVTNGLSFYYDMYNTEKSWKGEPVTNQFICPNPYDSNNNVSFNVNGTGTFQRIYSGTYGGYTIKPTDVVYRYNLGGNGCHYHGNSAAIASGQYVCYSVDYYISPDASDYPTDSTLVVLENYGGNALGGGTGAGGNGIMGKWQTIRGYSGPTGGSGTQAMFLYPGGCGNAYMASRGFILMKNPMFEFRGDVRYNPFVNGTRSNTQALVDLTGQNTVTASSLTYNNDGTFIIAGASNYISITNSSILRPSTELTIECIIKGSAPGSWTPILGYGNGDYTNGNYLVWVESGGSLNSLCRINNGGVTEYRQYPGYSVSSSNFQHMCFTMKIGDAIRSYRNGADTNTPTSLPSGGSFYYGGTSSAYQVGGSGGTWLNATVPLVRLYNRALSANEVAQNFAAQRGLYGL